MDTITITKQEYYELKVADEKLAALESGGVDNWDWYEEALSVQIREEIEERLYKQIFGEEF